MQTPIRIACAKGELARIDGVLESPLVLIGGLAVNQYDGTRDSFDIDLVCEHETARKILRELYPSSDWHHEDRNQDEYRPEFVIRHKVRKEYPALRFGPKITERRPYNYIRWDDLPTDAHCFRHKGKELRNILVPTAEKLCLMKLISYSGRARTANDKIMQDLRDTVALSNDDSFRLGEFYNLVRRWGFEDELKRLSRGLPDTHLHVFRESYLHKIATIFAPPVPADEMPTVWVIGSVTDLSGDFRDWAYKVADSLAHAFVARRLRVVMGRSQLLNYLGDRIAYEQIEPPKSVADDISGRLARESVRADNAGPSPVIILGSLRPAQGLKNFFLETIGRVPDIGVVIGGSRTGRAEEEARLALREGIPILPLPLTGGLAATIEASCDGSLAEEVRQVQTMSRGSNLIGGRVCDIVETQTRLRRQA